MMGTSVSAGSNSSGDSSIHYLGDNSPLQTAAPRIERWMVSSNNPGEGLLSNTTQ